MGCGSGVRAPSDGSRLKAALARGLRCLAVASLAGSSCHLARAENLARKWSIGGSVAYQATQDEIASNAAMASDPRPDDFISREIVVEDALRFDLTAGFGMSRLFSLRLDASYFEGNVGPVEAYLTDLFPISVNPIDPTVLGAFVEREEVVPVPAGRITEIPVTVSAIFRFRTDKPLNPYVGAGAGILFTQVEADGELVALNARMSRMRITGVVDENQVQITPPGFGHLRGQGKVPFTYPVSVEVEDAPILQGLAGVEYFLGDRISFTAELRYALIDGSVSIEMAGQDQIDLLIFSEQLFRPDGSLKIFNNGGFPPNPLVDPTDPSLGPVLCDASTQGDFDGDGQATDLCWDVRNFSGIEPEGTFVVQGGELDLSGFSVHLGMRFHF